MVRELRRGNESKNVSFRHCADTWDLDKSFDGDEGGVSFSEPVRMNRRQTYDEGTLQVDNDHFSFVLESPRVVRFKGKILKKTTKRIFQYSDSRFDIFAYNAGGVRIIIESPFYNGTLRVNEDNDILGEVGRKLYETIDAVRRKLPKSGEASFSISDEDLDEVLGDINLLKYSIEDGARFARRKERIASDVLERKVSNFDLLDRLCADLQENVRYVSDLSIINNLRTRIYELNEDWLQQIQSAGQKRLNVMTGGGSAPMRSAAKGIESVVRPATAEPQGNVLGSTDPIEALMRGQRISLTPWYEHK